MATIPGWDKINELAEKYSKLVTAPEGKEIYENKIGTEIDLRSNEQKRIANQVIEGMVPYIRRQAGRVLNSYVKIGKNIVSRRNARVELEELIGVGAVGIMKALGKYKKENTRFNTYATIRINSEIVRYIANTNGMVRLPVNIYEEASRILNSRAKTIIRDGKEIKVPMTRGKAKKEIAALITQRRDDMSPTDIANIILFAIKGKYVDINEPVNDEKGRGTKYEDVHLADPKADKEITESAEKIELEKLMRRTLATLTVREESVIRKRFYDEQSLEEIGQEYCVTRDYIRQIEARALRKLRHPSRAKKLVVAF